MSIVTYNPADKDSIGRTSTGTHTDNDDNDEDLYEHGANENADETTTAATTDNQQGGTLQTVNNQPAVSASAASRDTRGTYVEEGVMVEDVVMIHGTT